MSYRRRLQTWTVIRLLPRMQRVTIGRFNHYSDAEGHLQILRRLIPEGEFLLIFDPW
ncbi:hypothetical protein [Phormidesmis priestleyi]|uniref:hypothetical protein n=1 Tax=Phormidesmis priestleyi TaxID=268141 RepID=UPI000B0A2E62|nr:hypothetical protein [Phormidesmis priestleyi]